MITRSRVSLKVRVAAGVLAALVVLGGGWLWLRGSSLVAVRKVTITGVYGPDASQIRSALTLSARNMTTLEVRVDQLRTAVAPYPVVKDLRVSTQFPHGLRIAVIEQLPVAALTAGGRAVAVSGDGTLLRDVDTGSLPAIPVALLPGGSQVTDRAALDAVALLSAAPGRLLSRIAQVTEVSPHGLVAQLRSGPAIYFGDTSDLDAKWIAATEVLAEPGAAGATYIDVTDPARSAAGASPQAVQAAGLATTGTTTTGALTSGTSGLPSASGGASQQTAAPANTTAQSSATTPPTGG
jgi:cell division protein FtsQ